MTKFNKEIMKEYNCILEKYRKKFKKKYGKFPIIFEHGTPDPCGVCANCIIHAHTHIVNHNYSNEQEIIKKLNFSKIDNLYDIENNNYIYYKNPNGINYITYDFELISQIMRIFIAVDLGIKEKYNWKKYHFDDNINKTIEDLK